MGIILFLTAVIIEITFAVICIITKSNLQKVKCIVRITEFISIVLLSTLSIIHWNIRYYTLGALLLLPAIMAAVNLFKRKKENRPYKSVRIVVKAIGMMVLIFLATIPSIIFPQYVPIKPTGMFQVVTVKYTYTDTKRIETYTNTRENRKVNVELWYPKKVDGKYPLIIFSHGAFGIKASNETLFNELASHGYVVCSIDHTYQSLYTTDNDGKTILADKGYMKEVESEDAHTNKQQSYEYYQKWMKIRTDDINFVLDYILTQAKNNAKDIVYKLVNITEIGVMGHSLGGSAALGIGRMREDVKAVIALESPFLCDIKGVKNNEFIFTRDKYPIPVLNVYSDSSWGHLGNWSQYAENYNLLSNNIPTAFNAHIRGVGHMTLTDLALTSPFLTWVLNGQKSTTNTEYCLKVINKLCLQFFDCYLKGEGKFSSGGNY